MQPPTRHPVTINKPRCTTNVVVNARRDGKLKKKNAPRTAAPRKAKQQKVTNYLHAPTARCAPSIFNSFVDLLTMSQRIRINNMNFGGLLQIRADKLVSREMLKYLYDRLDPVNMVLDLGKDRVIHVNPFAVKQAFDIPDSGEELSLHTNQEACKALTDFKDFIGLEEAEDVHMKYLKEIWEADIELDSRILDDDMCIKIFFMLAPNKLLFPSSDNNIRAKDVYLARNLSRLPTMNWCKAVTDEIQAAARTWLIDRTTKVYPSITGCAIFLLIVYLDNLSCTHQINHKNIPRAKYFTLDLMKKIIVADKKMDDQGKVTFGQLPLRNINDTYYDTPDHFIPRMPANIQPVPPIQFPSLLSELGGVVNVTLAQPKRKLLLQAFAQFDINSKKAMTSINRGQLMLRSSHDQVIEKVRSILEVPNHSEGYGTNEHTHLEAHVPVQQNSPMEAVPLPQPMDGTANVESECELHHEHSPVHTDVTIGDVVSPVLDAVMDQGATGQASHIGSPSVNVHGGTSPLDSILDHIHGPVLHTAHQQTTTTDTMTSEPAVLTQNQHQLPNEVLRRDSTIDDEPLLPAEVPSTCSFHVYCNFSVQLTTILLFGDEHRFYDLIAQMMMSPSYLLRFNDLIPPLMMIPSYLLLFIQNRSVLQDAHPSDPMRTQAPMSKAKAVRKKFCPSLKSLNEVFISTGFIEFTGDEILGSFADYQELSTKFMSYFVQCLSHDESVHVPDGGGYRVFLSHRLGEYVNMEDDDEYSQWDSHHALEILEDDIAAVDTTKVKLFILPIMEQYHYTVYCINFIHDRIDILDSSPDDHRLYHEVVGNRIIPRLDALFDDATGGKLKSFTRFKRPILSVPLQPNETDNGFFAFKFMELWNGESFHVPILMENAGVYRDQLLYYAIYHQINTIDKLPAGLEALKPHC